MIETLGSLARQAGHDLGAVRTEQKLERKLKLLGVTPEFLLGLFSNEDPITISFQGLPADARCVGMHINVERQWIDLVIESDTFPAVPDYHILSRLDVTLSEHRPQSDEFRNT